MIEVGDREGGTSRGGWRHRGGQNRKYWDGGGHGEQHQGLQDIAQVLVEENGLNIWRVGNGHGGGQVQRSAAREGPGK